MDAWTACRHRRIETRVLLLLVLALTPNALAAQSGHDASTVGAAGGALVGGTVGFISGIFLGASGDCYELCHEIVVGAVAGEIIGVALGAHTFNRGRGSLLADLIVSSGVGLAGIAIARQTHRGEGGILLATTVAQLLGVVRTEVRTSPSLTVSAEVQPTAHGMGVGVRLRW